MTQKNGPRQLILIRHGQSIWNEENRFTGWTDVPLSKRGIEEAHRAARVLETRSALPDVAFTSVLRRATETLSIILTDLKLEGISVYKSWRLNERHYGALQGLDKSEVAEKFGAEQVFQWRRSYDLRPPALDPNDRRHPIFDPLYEGVPNAQLPAAESLKDCLLRLQPYWELNIAPAIRTKSRVLVVAHGNSIRAMLKLIRRIPDEEIAAVEVPTGVPLILDVATEQGLQRCCG